MNKKFAEAISIPLAAPFSLAAIGLCSKLYAVILMATFGGYPIVAAATGGAAILCLGWRLQKVLEDKVQSSLTRDLRPES